MSEFLLVEVNVRSVSKVKLQIYWYIILFKEYEIESENDKVHVTLLNYFEFSFFPKNIAIF